MLHRMDRLKFKLLHQLQVVLTEHIRRKQLLLHQQQRLLSQQTPLKLLLQSLLCQLGQLLLLRPHSRLQHSNQLQRKQTLMVNIITVSKDMVDMVNSTVHTVNSMGLLMVNSSSSSNNSHNSNSNNHQQLDTTNSNPTGKIKIKHTVNNRRNMDRVKRNKQVMGKIKHHKAIMDKIRANKIHMPKAKTNKIHMGKIKPHSHTAKVSRVAMDRIIMVNKGSSRASNRVVTTKANNRVVATTINKGGMGNMEIMAKTKDKVVLQAVIVINRKAATLAKINKKEIRITMVKTNKTSGIQVHQGEMTEGQIGNMVGNKITEIRTPEPVATMAVGVKEEIAMVATIMEVLEVEAEAEEDLIAVVAVDLTVEVVEDVVEETSVAEEVDSIAMVIMKVAMVVDVVVWAPEAE